MYLLYQIVEKLSSKGDFTLAYRIIYIPMEAAVWLSWDSESFVKLDTNVADCKESEVNEKIILLLFHQPISSNEYVKRVAIIIDFGCNLWLLPFVWLEYSVVLLDWDCDDISCEKYWRVPERQNIAIPMNIADHTINF